jgi:hypothetical protein
LANNVADGTVFLPPQGWLQRSAKEVVMGKRNNKPKKKKHDKKKGDGDTVVIIDASDDDVITQSNESNIKLYVSEDGKGDQTTTITVTQSNNATA